MNIGVTGSLGEEIAAKYLKNKGFSIENRNFKRSYGEIDIVAERSGELLFVEVKAVTCEIGNGLDEDISRITDEYFPEERVTRGKKQKLSRIIHSYLSKMGRNDTEWSFAVVGVFVDSKAKKALVRLIGENLSS